MLSNGLLLRVTGLLVHSNKPLLCAIGLLFISNGQLLHATGLSACLVLNPITVYSYGFLFNCSSVGQASDSMTALT